MRQLIAPLTTSYKPPPTQSKSTALGLKKNMTSPNFLITLTFFRDVLLAVNRDSVYLQTKEIDMIQVMGMMRLLKEELTNIRNSSEYWDTSVAKAKALAATVDVNLQEALEDKDENTR